MKKKLLCAVMCCVLICGTFAPKKAYAVAGVDDAAVVIVCALLAAAGVTFATNDGVQDAVQGFLEYSAGRFDSTIERLASGYAVYGSVGAFKIPSMAMGGVRLLLEGMFDYFKTDENRQGSVVISAPPGGVLDLSYVLDASDPAVISYFDLNFSGSAPAYVIGKVSESLSVSYLIVSTAPFSFDYFSNYFSIRQSLSSSSVAASICGKLPGSDVYPTVFYSSMYMKDKADGKGYSPLFGDVVLLPDSGIKPPFSSKDESYRDFVSLLFGFSGIQVEKSIPYGLTFPEELTAPDVIDNFEQRVEAAAGDLAIVVPVDGVIDNTLPYAEAQEQYLANVNELGEITDTVTETNSWLSKILTAVKSIPAKVIGTGTLDFSGFQNIGLSSVFPFCIPFDLKNALVGFNVTPADPIWEISFEGTFMSAAGTYVLDMTKFEKLFAIVRFFIYGGFVVSLILLTRKIIKG